MKFSFYWTSLPSQLVIWLACAGPLSIAHARHLPSSRFTIGRAAASNDWRRQRTVCPPSPRMIPSRPTASVAERAAVAAAGSVRSKGLGCAAAKVCARIRARWLCPPPSAARLAAARPQLLAHSCTPSS